MMLGAAMVAACTVFGCRIYRGTLRACSRPCSSTSSSPAAVRKLLQVHPFNVEMVFGCQDISDLRLLPAPGRGDLKNVDGAADLLSFGIKNRVMYALCLLKGSAPRGPNLPAPCARAMAAKAARVPESPRHFAPLPQRPHAQYE